MRRSRPAQAEPCPSARSRSRSRRARFGGTLLALLLVTGYLTFREVTGAPIECAVAADGQQLALQPDQAANAATIGAVAASRDLPERALTIALATAMQESRLRNLPGGDRDSIGLFQQRPSQGWGTAEQIRDPVYSANQFFDELLKIPGYERLPVTVAAQQVQHSGYPEAYAKQTADATLLASALSGRVPSLTCRIAPDGRSGSAAAVSGDLTRAFGPLVLPSQETVDEVVPAHRRRAATRALPAPAQPVVTGRTITVPGTLGTADQVRRGWVLAQWAVAHADDLRIAEVSYDGHVWRVTDGGGAWSTDGGTGSGANAFGGVRITVER